MERKRELTTMTQASLQMRMWLLTKNTKKTEGILWLKTESCNTMYVGLTNYNCTTMLLQCMQYNTV